jgi:hypothetical protein
VRSLRRCVLWVFSAGSVQVRGMRWPVTTTVWIGPLLAAKARQA